MTDTKNLAPAVRDRATAGAPPHTHQSPGWRRWTDVLMHRWPTAIGVALAALTVFDLEVDTESISSLSALTVLMALVYLGAAALDQRRAAWAVLVAGFAVLVLMRSTAGVVPSVILLVAALVFLLLGVARGQLRRPGGLALQTTGMLAFGATVLVALSVDPDLGVYLVAFALLGHAAWDAYHYLQNRVVPRSYAEFCAVVDLLLGAALLFLT